MERERGGGRGGGRSGGRARASGADSTGITCAMSHLCLCAHPRARRSAAGEVARVARRESACWGGEGQVRATCCTTTLFETRKPKTEEEGGKEDSTGVIYSIALASLQAAGFGGFRLGKGAQEGATDGAGWYRQQPS